MFKEYNEYFETLQIDKSKHTVRAYTHILGRFIEYFKIENIDDIKKLTDKDIQSYLNFLTTKITAKNLDTAKSSANSHYRSIKAFMNWLVSHGYMETAPILQVRRYKEAKKIAVIFTKEERDAIILATKKRPNLQMMMAVLFYTGLRREEAVNVKVSDINNGVLTVHGKGNKERELSLTTFVMEMINKDLARRKVPCEYLFVSLRGNHQITPEALLARVKIACQMAGISEEKISKIGAHSIRRSFACFLLLDGWSTFAISKALGHSSILTTEKYVEPAKSLASTRAMLGQASPSWYEEK